MYKKGRGERDTDAFGNENDKQFKKNVEGWLPPYLNYCQDDLLRYD
jgi:hypothetical protein